jgi:hypothetical protein
MARLSFFHLFPAVWQDGTLGRSIWAQIRKQLDEGGDLDKSERAVLAELLKRMNERPQARKALGIRPRSRTADRNDRIADHYMQLRAQGKSATAAASATAKQFPAVGARAVRGVLESGEILAAARVRALPRMLLAKKTPTK